MPTGGTDPNRPQLQKTNRGLPGLVQERRDFVRAKLFGIARESSWQKQSVSGSPPSIGGETRGMGRFAAATTVRSIAVTPALTCDQFIDYQRLDVDRVLEREACAESGLDDSPTEQIEVGIR